jgi:hypothetical protein
MTFPSFSFRARKKYLLRQIARRFHRGGPVRTGKGFPGDEAAFWALQRRGGGATLRWPEEESPKLDPGRRAGCVMTLIIEREMPK